jgi:cytochrome P450
MPTLVSELPTLNVDFLDRGLVNDPYPTLEAIRAAGPVVYNKLADRYMVTSYRHCAEILGNTRMFNSQQSVPRVKALFGGITMQSLDGPSHGDVRGIWAEQFLRAGVQQHREMITQVVDQRLLPFVDRVRSGETVDAVPAMTRGIPVLVIAHMLGIEPGHFQQFSDWSDAMAAKGEATLDRTERGRELIRKGEEATAALNEYVRGQLRKRRESDDRDLIDKMNNSPYAREHLAEQDKVASITQLVFAGNETTAGLMATALVVLARHPDQRLLLARDRSLIPQALEEIHRCNTLSQSFQRHACSDEAEVAGVSIPNGAEMMPLLGAANRDPDRWPDPNCFDLLRQRKSHLGFGFGIHSCLGINLARLEAQIWLNRLLDELPGFTLEGETDWGTSFSPRRPVAVYVQA